jgi:hypothetical protein
LAFRAKSNQLLYGISDIAPMMAMGRVGIQKKQLRWYVLQVLPPFILFPPLR